MPRLPMAASTGRARSSVAAAPPTRNSSSPEAACVRLPVTGASSSSQPGFGGVTGELGDPRG